MSSAAPAMVLAAILIAMGISGLFAYLEEGDSDGLAIGVALLLLAGAVVYAAAAATGVA